MIDTGHSPSTGARNKRLAVGISLFARDGQAIWENGIHQNIAYLTMLLKKSDQIGPIYFLSGGDANTLPVGLDVPLVNLSGVSHELNVVIEMGAQLQVTNDRSL